MARQEPNPVMETIGPTIALCAWPLVIIATIIDGYPGLTRPQAVKREIRRFFTLMIEAPLSLFLIPLAWWLWSGQDNTPNYGCGPYDQTVL